MNNWLLWKLTILLKDGFHSRHYNILGTVIFLHSLCEDLEQNTDMIPKLIEIIVKFGTFSEISV